MDKVLELLAEPMRQGLTVGLYMEESTPCFDLNTGAKSGCVLKVEEDNVIRAYRRYGRVDVVEDYEDLLGLISGCGHGRDYFSAAWIRCLEMEGYSDPTK